MADKSNRENYDNKNGSMHDKYYKNKVEQNKVRNHEIKNSKIYTRNRLRVPKFKMTFLDQKTKRKNQKIIQIVAIVSIAITVAYFSLQAIEPIMVENSKNMAKSIATKICNNETTKVMAKYNYDDFLTITKDEQGNIKMVGTNIVTVNEVISDIPVHIQEELEKSENNQFTIRLGSFLGSKLFARKGTKCQYKNGSSRQYRNRLKIRI